MFKTEREAQDAAFEESLRTDKEKEEAKDLAVALAAVAALEKKIECVTKELTMEELRAARLSFFNK